MRFTLSKAPVFAALGWLALAGPGLAVAQTGATGGKILFSEPSNPTIASNLIRLDPNASRIKQVEDDLFKPFRFRTPQSDMKYLMSFPPPQQLMPVMPDQHTMEMIEKRKNWAFTDWNDLFPDPASSEGSDSELDGNRKKPVSLIERYFESAKEKPSSATNRLSINAWFNHSLTASNTFDPAAETFSVEGQFRKLMKQIVYPRSADDADKNVIDFNHVSFRQFSAEEVQEQKRRHEEFQQLLDPHWAANHANELNAAVPAQPGAATNLFESTTPHQSLTGPAPGAADPTAKAFYSHVYDDPTAVALGQTNNLLTPKPVQPLIPPPTLTPFDNLPKRKF